MTKKRDSTKGVFSSKYWKTFKNAFFHRKPPVNAFALWCHLLEPFPTSMYKPNIAYSCIFMLLPRRLFAVVCDKTFSHVQSTISTCLYICIYIYIYIHKLINESIKSIFLGSMAHIILQMFHKSYK